MPTLLSEALKAVSARTPDEGAPERSSRLQALHKRLASIAQQSDKVLFEGRWMSGAEATRQYRRLKLQSWLKILEMLLVFFFALFLLMIPVAVLAILGAIGS